jgi:hypothetical protein
MTHALNQWLASLRLYVRICLFLAAPSDLPYSPASIVLTLSAYLLTALYLLGDEYEFVQIITLISVEVIILYAISLLVLKARGFSARLMQTLSALFGSGLVISLIGIPLLAMVTGDAEGSDQSLARNLNLALLLWSLAVISLIFKRAFEISTIAAGFLAFNYFFLYELIIVNFLQ